MRKVEIWELFVKQRKGDGQLGGRVESFKNEFGTFALGKIKKAFRTEFRGHFVKLSVD